MRYLIFIFLLSPVFLFSQGSKHVVIDKLTSEPIANVHVIVTNSSLSTYSDQDGIFTIDQESIAGLDIILSHISHELITIAMPLGFTLPDTIAIAPLAIEVANVQIVGKKSNVKRKRIKEFKRDLFTSDDSKVHFYWKKCIINNPEAILFYSGNDTTYAESSKLISITNPYLGYDMQFLLDDYYSTKRASALNGKLMFSEMENLKTSKKKINRRRLEHYNRSTPNFFAHVLTNKLADTKFECYIKDPTGKENEYLEFLKDGSHHDYVKKTVVPGVFALICPSDVYVIAEGRQSILSADYGVILFNKKGVILNKNEVTIQGYWSRLSLSEQLPMDFKEFDYDSNPMIAFDRAYTILELRNYEVEDKTEVESIRIQELVVETDRLLYKKGEDLYLAGHIFNHDTKKLIKGEQILTIDLLNSDKVIVDTKQKLVNGGTFESGFELSDTLKSGQYAVHVHSELPTSLSGYRVIGINTLYNHPELLKNETDSVMVSFHPEGGKFVQGFMNRILVKVQDELGNEIPFSGRLEDEVCGNVIPMKTICDGMAIVNLMSVKDCNYKLVTDGKRKVKVNYDALRPSQGASLNITVRNKEFFSVKVLSNIDLKNYQLYVIYLGNVVYTLGDLDTESVYKLNKNLFQNGMLDFQLRDAKGKVVSSRLVDHSALPTELITARMNYAFYNQKQEGEVTFTLQDTSLKELKWNLRIINGKYDPEIKKVGALEALAPVLSEVNFAALRNSMVIGEELDGKYSKYYESGIGSSFMPRTQRLTGRTMDVDSDQPITASVSITHLGENFYFDEVETGEDGKFSFENLPFIEGGEFVIQARKDVKRGKGTGSRNVKIVMDRQVRDEYFDIQFSDKLTEEDYTVDSFISARPSFSLNVDMDEVTVEARKIDVRSKSSMYNLNDMDWIRDNSSGIDLLTRLHSAKRVQKDPLNSDQLQVWVREGEPVARFKRLKIFIDGQEQLNASVFMSMIADEIAFIGIEKETLIVVRTPDLKRRSKKKAEKYGIHNHIFTENIDVTDKEYVNIAKGIASNEFDGRKTLYWDSGITFTSAEKTIQFLTSRIAGTYQIEMSTIHPQFGYVSYDWSFEVR